MSRRRRAATVAAWLATTLLLALAGLAFYARDELADERAFAARAAAAFDDRAVRDAAANRLVDRLATSVSAEVLVVRPLLVAGLREAFDSASFRRLVARAASGAHRRLVDGEDAYTLVVQPSSPVIADTLRGAAPRIAARLPRDLRFELLRVGFGEPVLRGSRAVFDLASLAWVLLLAALAGCATLVWLAGRRAGAALAAAAVGGGALLVVVASAVAGRLVRGDGPASEARAGIFTALAGDLDASALPVALAALLVAVVLMPAGRRADAWRTARGAARSPLPAARRTRVAALAGVVALALVAAAVISRAPELPPVAATAGAAAGCNGSVALCDRRLDQVVFPGTHNSYSAADEPGWLFANQRFGIGRQLQDGIRAFLIDVHRGVPSSASGRVRTDLAGEGSSRSKVARTLSPQALLVADRVAGRVGGPLEGERQPYLCHTLCELGSEPLEAQLQLFADFLARSPREVVVLFVEPYVEVEELEQAMIATGLLEQAAALDPGRPLPTLRALIAARTRLVVLTEQDGGARPWYLDGFAFAQDTPLGARTPAGLRCTRFRGEPDSPILLLNHWLDTVPPSPTRNAAIAGDALRSRAERCTRSRGVGPGILAVDFHDRSGVVEVAAALNARPR